MKKLTTVEFIEQARLVHNDKYDYSKVNYIRAKTKVDIVCPNHGMFTQLPILHLKGSECKKCAVETRKTTMIERYGVDVPTKSPQIQQQIKQTNFEKYGCHPSQLDTTKNKQISTNLDRYGVKWTSQLDTTKNKQISTNLARYGVGCLFTSSTIKEQIKQTNLLKYGATNPQQNVDIQQKTKQTNLARYGVGCLFTSSTIKEQIKQTNLLKYGATNPQQNVDIQQKTKQTNLARYGCHPSSSSIVKQQIKQRNLLKYGVTNPNQKHMVDVLPLLEDHEWLFDQYITQNKTATHISNELGISDTTIGHYLRKHEIKIKQQFWSSYKCQIWLEQQEPEIIPEWNIPGTKFRADGYCESTNTIYEFHGDYWHGNPTIYQPDEMNEVVGKTMGELYNQTILRENLITSLGYTLVVMWESDLLFPR